MKCFHMAQFCQTCIDCSACDLLASIQRCGYNTPYAVTVKLQLGYNIESLQYCTESADNVVQNQWQYNWTKRLRYTSKTLGILTQQLINDKERLNDTPRNTQDFQRREQGFLLYC